jgi:poly-gamma-glutamate synthesis protein (capsule biosynthesis protein)
MTAKLFFAGDCVLYGNVSSNIFSEELFALFKEHDICCCNFEAPIESKNAKPILKVGTVLCQPKEVIERLKSSGFNLFAIANNHIMDYGIDGLRETISAFGNTPYIGAGFDSDSIYKPYINNIAIETHLWICRRISIKAMDMEK